MVICTVCINPESGTYLAISCEDPDLQAIGVSHEEALGLLVFENPGIKVDNAIRIEAKK